MTSLALHGFLGAASDWDGIAPAAIELPLDVPGVADVAGYSDWLWRQLAVKPRRVIGYSMGARIAMHWLDRVEGAILIAGHPGDAGNRARLQRDRQWQQRFATEPLDQVLDAWYAQPLFAGRDNRTAIARRYRGRGAALGHQLVTLTVARQRPQPLGRVPIHYLTGEHDPKYRDIGERLARRHPKLHHHVIAGAGHNCLLDRPDRVREIIEEHA